MTSQVTASSSTNNNNKDDGSVKKRISLSSSSSSSYCYDPARIVSISELDVPYNLLVHPVWIFDSYQRQMRWANQAGIELWNANSLHELVQRDFASDMSASTAKRLEETLLKCSQGQYVVDQWTLYPKGQAKTVHLTFSGIRLQEDTPTPFAEGDNTLPHMCFLIEAVPVFQEEVDQNVLRGVEMLRHLPIAVCQFDMNGSVMFQNPQACMLQGQQGQQDDSETEDTTTGLSNEEEDDLNDDDDDDNEDDGDDETCADCHHEMDRCAGDDHHNPQEDKGRYKDEVSHSAIHDDEDSSERTATTARSNCSSSSSSSGSSTSTTTTNDTSVCSSSRRKRLSTTTTTATASATSSSCNDDHKDHCMEKDQPKKKKKKTSRCGNLIHRFVDVNLGKQVLSQIQTMEIVDVEAMLHTSQGPTWSAIQLRQSKDPITGKVVILYSARDKSDAIQAQKERQASEQKSEFLAIMAHEIRTPLHQVTGFIDLLDQTTQLDVEQKSIIRILKSSAQGLMTVISDVLDYSKLEAGKMKLEHIPYEPLSVTKCTIEAIRANCEERHIQLQLQWDNSIPFKLKSDPNRLRQILLNLLSNAVKFTKPDGTITVQSMYITKKNDLGKQQRSNDNEENHKNQDDPRRPIPTTSISSSSSSSSAKDGKRSNEEKRWVRFVVQDTGIGISEEQQKTIFQQYQQANAAIARNFGGTGLGLSICQLLVQMMGGQMGVTSQLGYGSKFWFELPADLPTEKDLAGDVDDDDDDLDGYSTGTPLSPTPRSNGCPPRSNAIDQPAATAIAGSGGSAAGSGLNILVVEDNKVNQRLLSKMLQRMGHTAMVAENGKEAIDLVEQQKMDDDDPSHFDLVLMDIQMPVMCGLEATKRLRTMGYTNLPIYGLTASVARSDYIELGFNDWLPKPIRMKDLKLKLGRLSQ